MKNLKKVLALVLAFACAFTMFAGAAFSDQADIQSTEAVDALTGLGVIQGYTDGSFRPDVTVTRAEMAKMIFTILNGGNDDASAYENLPTSFTDLNDDWYKGYIKYLQNSGIIAGKSATRFAPNETVTGVEAAKMLLVVAGYDADKAGLTGLSWMANTMKYANLNNLFEDVDADVNAGLPRQYAAQIMYNSLDMERVVYSNDIGDFKPAEDVKDDATIGAKYLDLKFYGKDADESVVLYGTEKEANRDTYSLTTSGKDFTRVANDYSDLVGQRVVVMHKVDKTNEVYGVYAYEDSTVVATGYVGQLEYDSAKTDAKIKLDGTSYKLEVAAEDAGVYAFGDDTASTKLDTLTDLVTKDGNDKQNDVARSIKLIDNDGNGKVDTIMSSPVKFGQVSYVGTSSMTVTGMGSLKYDDISGYEDIAKDDYVFVTDDRYNSSDKDVVVKADITSAEIEATRSNAGGDVIEARVDGVWYRTAENVTVVSGTSYDMVLCGNYILAADETSETTVEDVALLGGVKHNATGAITVESTVGTLSDERTVKARLYFADSTNEEVTLSKYDGKKLVDDSTASPSDNQIKVSTALGRFVENSGEYNDIPALVTFSKLADGTYDVKAVATGNLAGCDKYDPQISGDQYADSKINDNPIADNAVIYVKAATEIKVLTGAAVQDWADSVTTTGSYALLNTVDGLDYVQVAYLPVNAQTVPGASSDIMFGYLVRDPYLVNTDDGKKATYEIWTNEGAKTVTVDSSSYSEAAGDVIAYSVNGNFVELESVAVLDDAAIIGTDRKVEGTAKVAMDSTVAKTYSFDEDCVFVAIDDSETAGAEGDISGIPTAQKCGTNTYIANAIVAINSEGKIVAVFYDVDNMLDRGTSVGGAAHDTYDAHIHFTE